MVLQVVIVITGAAAIWFVGRRENWKRWGYIIGLVGQPCWLYVTWKSGQWGMFALSVWYTYAWLQGIYYHWTGSNI